MMQHQNDKTLPNHPYLWNKTLLGHRVFVVQHVLHQHCTLEQVSGCSDVSRAADAAATATNEDEDEGRFLSPWYREQAKQRSTTTTILPILPMNEALHDPTLIPISYILHGPSTHLLLGAWIWSLEQLSWSLERVKSSPKKQEVVSVISSRYSSIKNLPVET